MFIASQWWSSVSGVALSFAVPLIGKRSCSKKVEPRHAIGTVRKGAPPPPPPPPLLVEAELVGENEVRFIISADDDE